MAVDSLTETNGSDRGDSFDRSGMARAWGGGSDLHPGGFPISVFIDAAAASGGRDCR